MRLAFLLILGLWSVAWARPPVEGEPPLGSAVCIGEKEAESFHISGDMPGEFLTWSYHEPEWREWFLDYSAWEPEFRRYLKRTYGVNSLHFTPSMIVMHYTVVPTAERTWAVLARRHVSVHFMIDRDGTIYQLWPLDRRCNGAYGVNHKAISIEMVAATEGDLLSRPRQVFASFCLVRYLMDQYDIKPEKVVGHYEVGMGVTRVPDYLDLFDRYYSTRYPPNCKRTDPGEHYMRWLRTALNLRR